MALKPVLISAFAASFLPTLAAAEGACGDPIVMIRSDGVAAYTIPPDEIRQATLDQVRPQMGNPPADRPVLVIDLRSQRGSWVPREDIGAAFRDYGAIGDGYLYSGPDHCAPPELPILPFDPADPDPKPIEIFDDEACTHGPRDGTWIAEIGATQIQGCPAQMQQVFSQSQAILPSVSASPGQLSFSCPFHPDTLDLSKTTGVHWQEAGPERWTTTDLAAAQFAQIPRGEGGGSHILWTLNVVSPDEITFTRSIEIVLPAEAAAILGSSPDGCRITGTDRWKRTGD